MLFRCWDKEGDDLWCFRICFGKEPTADAFAEALRYDLTERLINSMEGKSAGTHPHCTIEIPKKHLMERKHCPSRQQVKRDPDSSVPETSS
jgi:hypothetical protein